MLNFDFLVLGSGSAGLNFALEVAEYGSVGIITKKNSAESNTNYAQGGIAAVLDATDSTENHIHDTLVAGAGLCDPVAVKLIVEEGPKVVRELIRMGADFTKSKQENLDLGREGGHSHNRIVHAADMTGKEIERVLLAKVDEHPNITILEHHFALELITEHHLGKKVTRYNEEINCYGAYALNIFTEKVETILARCTLLATGGACQVYRHTTNPAIATGDGIAMAFRAKARLANMEFIQFHPTSLFLPGANSFLISEAVRGAGGILRDKSGYAFMTDYDERKELAPRDIVARAIDDKLKKSGDNCVYLDVTHLSDELIKEHFPNIFKKCLSLNLDITKSPIPVVPAAHYMCGGVITNYEAETNIRGLLAAGEVACTGVHGANRLASNSLLEALVFAKVAAKTAVNFVKKRGFQSGIPNWDESNTHNTEEWVLVAHNKSELQYIMTNYVGIMRSTERLNRAFRRTKLLYQEVEDFYQHNKVSVALCELRNLIAVSYLTIKCALMRKESRGLHFTTDFPDSLDSERHNSII